MEGPYVVKHSPTQPATMDEQEILDNIDGRMHGPMPGFIGKFFGQSTHVHRDDGSVQAASPTPGNFLRWFSNFVSEKFDGDRALWQMLGDNVAANQEQANDGIRLLLTMPPSPTSNTRIEWGHVQVIGQFYDADCVSYQHGLLRLCQSAQRVFASQPTRPFLHGFYIRGSQIEFWLFDRSGLYCSDVFDLQKDFNQAISSMLSYGQMTDEQRGKLKLINTDTEGSYITLQSASKPSLEKLYLECQPIACREDLIGTGTTCYRARSSSSNHWDHVLKFKWRWARHRPEDELLKLSKEKCATAVISLDYYEEIESTANLRAGLRWGTHRRFSKEHSHYRHKGVEDLRQATGLADYTEQTENYFQNRILTCLVTSPVGRPLDTFRSLIELLQVFRDAIQCHRSLYQDARILHQDISPGNMIILDHQDEGQPKGMLIDLDSAVHLEADVESSPGIIGTRPFMAIGVLKGDHHTYRHDLESFFYVFLWTIITNRAEDPAEASKLRQWSKGNWDELAACKCRHVDCHGFENILGEFTSEFHPLKLLAEIFRGILFPLRDGIIWIGTDTSAEAVHGLYDQVIYAFEEAILGLQSSNSQ